MKLHEERIADDRENAPLFSLFEALLPNENALSRMLKYLLDPSAAHGQVRTFLDQFLTLLGANEGELLDRAFRRITTEHSTATTRRIDIVLWLDGCVVGIENKPWAGEGDNQCGDYCKELQRVSPGGWMLVFLTADGRPAESGGEFMGSIKRLRYDQIVAAFQTKCKRVQPFLSDFERFVRKRINGETPVSHPGDEQMIDEFVRPDNMRVTVEILIRATEIRRKVVSFFRDEMLARVRNDFGDRWNAVIQNGSGARPVLARDFDSIYCGLYFFKPEWESHYAIGFSNQSANAKHFNFGVYYWGRIQKERIAAGGLQSALNQEFVTASNGTDHWDWERYLRVLRKPEYDDWYGPDVMRAMALDKGRMTDDLYPILHRTITIAEPMIDGEPRPQQESAERERR